jgi:RNA processing factor Prp31
MRTRWKLLGLAGAAGVAATGAIAARNRRPQSDYAPDELRERLRERLEKVQAGGEPPPVVEPKGPSG